MFLHALHVEVHFFQLGVAVVCRCPALPCRIDLQRASKRVQLASLDGVTTLFGQFFHRSRHGRAKSCRYSPRLFTPHHRSLVFQVPVCTSSRVFFVDHAPVEHRSGQLRLCRQTCSCRNPSQARLFLRGLHHGRRVGVLHQHIATLRNQRQCGLRAPCPDQTRRSPRWRVVMGRVKALMPDHMGMDAPSLLPLLILPATTPSSM